MKIAHGGFQRAVAHRHLDGARADPVLHAVSCETVAIIPSSE